MSKKKNTDVEVLAMTSVDIRFHGVERAPIITATRVERGTHRGYVRVLCPYCGENHHHDYVGDEVFTAPTFLGFRLSHCEPRNEAGVYGYVVLPQGTKTASDEARRVAALNALAAEDLEVFRLARLAITRGDSLPRHALADALLRRAEEARVKRQASAS
jgi:hypothetical protein